MSDYQNKYSSGNRKIHTKSTKCQYNPRFSRMFARYVVKFIGSTIAKAINPMITWRA